MHNFTHRRWISKINNVIRQLQDCIEREIQSHFGNFEERVVKVEEYVPVPPYSKSDLII